jgi:stress-induced morphogen
MISEADVIAMIQKTIPGADVTVRDTTGTSDHLAVEVVAASFAGMSPMNRHRLVQKSVAEAMADGRIHALEIKTRLPG